MSKGDDFIRSTGNMAFVNTFLKFTCLVLAVAVLGLSGMVVYLGASVRNQKPLPIFIDNDSGSARPVDFQAIDAAGENRVEPEIISFANDYIGNLYTYNKYTVKSNLENVLAVSSEEAVNALRRYWKISARQSAISSGGQGLSKIQSSVIVNGLPDLRVQVFFQKMIVGSSGDEGRQTKHVAVLRIKTVVRSVGNPHGLHAIEYREDEVNQ